MKNNPKGKIGEFFVNTIAKNAFLEYWCYPNPYDEKGNKKEISDLLIIFREVLIIISVKNYEFKGNYDRFFNNTIKSALKQIQGAERKLFGEREIFIKHPKKELEKFNKKNISKIFRIIINLDDNVKFYHPSTYTKSNKHVTIMTGKTWLAITQEMNTIKDFTSYLSEREELLKDKNVIMLSCSDDEYDKETDNKFINRLNQTLNLDNKKQVIISGTELDLLASYINNSNSYPENLKTGEFNSLYFDIDKTWLNFTSNLSYAKKKQNDKQSFFIDNFVKNEIGYNEKTKIIGEKLMSLSRFERRIVSKSFFKFYDKYRNMTEDKFARAFTEVSEYGFIFAKYPKKMDFEMQNGIFTLAVESFHIHTKYIRNDYILIAYHSDFEGLRFANMSMLEKFTLQL
jgi:hypothetical protein